MMTIGVGDIRAIADVVADLYFHGGDMLWSLFRFNALARTWFIPAENDNPVSYLRLLRNERIDMSDNR